MLKHITMIKGKLKLKFIMHCLFICVDSLSARQHFSVMSDRILGLKIVSEYDQEIPQSQTAANPWHREEEPLNHHETPGRQIKQSDQLSLAYQDDCNTRMDIK